MLNNIQYIVYEFGLKVYILFGYLDNPIFIIVTNVWIQSSKAKTICSNRFWNPISFSYHIIVSYLDNFVYYWCNFLLMPVNPFHFPCYKTRKVNTFRRMKHGKCSLSVFKNTESSHLPLYEMRKAKNQASYSPLQSSLSAFHNPEIGNFSCFKHRKVFNLCVIKHRKRSHYMFHNVLDCQKRRLKQTRICQYLCQITIQIETIPWC